MQFVPMLAGKEEQQHDRTHYGVDWKVSDPCEQNEDCLKLLSLGFSWMGLTQKRMGVGRFILFSTLEVGTLNILPGTYHLSFSLSLSKYTAPRLPGREGLNMESAGKGYGNIINWEVWNLQLTSSAYHRLS
jgi:hypothetical protein